MKNGKIFFIIAGILLPSILGASGISQAIFSEDYDAPLGGLDYVLTPHEVWLDEYIAQADYNYSLPKSGPFNVIPLTDIRDSTAYLMIGLKGKKEAFEALPPMNLCFVIDTSVYMEQDQKLEWVKDSFRAYIDLVRKNDIVSVVTFGGQAELLVPPTLIQTQADRDQFNELIEGLEPGGAADMYQGMLVGYAEVETNYQGDYLNRVLLLSGGRDNSGYPVTEFLKANGVYNQQGIDISTLALGMDSDINLLADIAAVGGGAFRFIPDSEMMEQAFGGELDRLVVPAVWKIDLELSLAPGVRFRETWGYPYGIDNDILRFRLGTLHNGDSKTLVTIVDLESPVLSRNALGYFSLLYTDTRGKTWKTGSFPLTLGPAALQNRRALTEPRIRKVEGVIALGKSLIDIGNRVMAITQVEPGYGVRHVSYHEDFYEPVSAWGAAVQSRIATELENCLEIIRTTWDYLADISNNNYNIDYAKELQILEEYEYTFNQIYGDYCSYY
ncbi:MAG: VWA domain-containing protein [Spirochaetaceae bacterium]|jgi:uncharacterized protein YegL|nr:VWA domain-containing protein [Spirochaetaceae bacterium]